jgi:dTDP-4-dehydrorhamnose reductase
MNNSSGSLVIVGANGFVGRNLSKFASQFMNVHLMDSNQFNIPAKLNKSSVFVYLRAISSPTFVQINPELSHEINSVKTFENINEALSAGHRVIFASSDIVYGHSSTKVFSERDPENPWGLYAKQKKEIEDKFVAHENFISLRLSLITGNGSKLEQILKYESSPKIAQGVIRNPVHIDFVLESICRLMKVNSFRSVFPQGCVNIGGKESVEIFDLALTIAKMRRFNTPIRVQRGLEDLSARPAITRITSQAAEEFVGLDFRL